jgi:dTDP-glucose 4,6-dehydratase
MTNDRSPYSRILVTGGAGFIGSNLVRWLLRNVSEASIVILDSLTASSNPANLHSLPKERVSFIKGDVCDWKIVDQAISGVDAIIHLAAESHNDTSIDNPESFLRSNIYGTFQILKAAKQNNIRLHIVSTDEVFGDLRSVSEDRFTEASPYNPSSPYSATKAAADMLAKAWYRTYSVPVTISCCSNNYGPRQNIEKFIPRQITRILSGKKPELYGDGLNIRDWIHVEDHCSAIWSILVKGIVGETYLVTANCEVPNIDIVRTILRIMGKDEGDFVFVEDRPGHDFRYASDATKLRCATNWSPSHTDFIMALEKTILWYEENTQWWHNPSNRI